MVKKQPSAFSLRQKKVTFLFDMNTTLDLSQFSKGLFLKQDGTWLHDGEPVIHQRLSELLHRCIKRRENGDLGVTTGRDWLSFKSEDAPLRIVSAKNLHGQQLLLSLSNETQYLLVPSSLALIVDQENQWRTAIIEQQLWARWTFNALQSITPLVENSDNEYALKLNPPIPIVQLKEHKNWSLTPSET